MMMSHLDASLPLKENQYIKSPWAVRHSVNLTSYAKLHIVQTEVYWSKSQINSQIQYHPNAAPQCLIEKKGKEGFPLVHVFSFFSAINGNLDHNVNWFIYEVLKPLLKFFFCVV